MNQSPLFTKLSTEAFEKEKNATAALRKHVKSCWVCRFGRVVGFFIRCLSVENLLREHQVASQHADAYRDIVRVVRDEEVPETPSVDWLENLYKQ